MMNPGRVHRRQFQRLLAMMGTKAIVELPTSRSTEPLTDVEKVMGRRERPDEVGETREVTVIWRNGHNLLDEPSTPPEIVRIGRVNGMDAVLRCDLDSVLVDPTKKQGQTIFDLAKSVVYQGSHFKVVATDRTGLPLDGPYILWVALRKAE